MKREDAKKLLPIIQAYAEGKKIQVKFPDDSWHDAVIPIDFDCEPDKYRIKPEEAYRPYKDCDEMIEDFKKRFNVAVPDYAMPLIWVESNNDKQFITEFNYKSYIYINSIWYSLGDLFKYFTYLDGSPCGVKENEKTWQI